MMPRSSRHKSSKHSSRDTREYSDSEKDSSLKDRKSKEESSVVRVSKDSGSTEKRKFDLKDGKDPYGGSGNGDYSEDLVSSKRRKGRVEDGGSDRWNGGEDDHRGSKKSSKASGESKSKKRDESVELYAEGGGEVKKSSTSSGKGEGKHRDRDRDKDKESIRKEAKESGGADRDKERDREREKEKKGKDGRTERLVSADEKRVPAKQTNEKTDINVRGELESPESENQKERRIRKRRDDFGDVGKHLNETEDTNDGRLSSRDDSERDGRQKDEKRKDERYREKYREDIERDNKHRDDKRDERPTKDQPSSKSDNKNLRDEKDLAEMQQKRSKLQDGERKGDHERDRNRDRDSYHARDRDRYHDREREHLWDYGRDRDREYERDWDWDRERDGDRERDRNHDRGRERDRDGDRERDNDRDYDGSHLDDLSTRYKDSSRVKKRSPDDRDDGSETKSRGIKTRYSDLEKKTSSGDRVESDVPKGRSQSRQGYGETMLTNNKRRTSPSSNSHVVIDESRYLNPEDKYRDSVAAQRSKAIPPRDGPSVSGISERGSKYRSVEKPVKLDDGHFGELAMEKSSSSKPSPLPLTERSPSSSNIERRYMNRTGVRRNLDIEETGRRNRASVDRDFSNTEDRPSRDLPSEKPLMDESSPADSSAHSRNSQSKSSMFPHPNFRTGIDSPFVGSVEEDSRSNSNTRYRRNSDSGLVRAHGNAWRGVPSWTPPVPNGFMHFQHGGPHGGLMHPQFPPPQMFGVRPSMEINHAGIPYHMPDADRFSSHLRPWQNMMDGSGPPHLHIWEGTNGPFRDESHIYVGPEWDQNRHPMTTPGWEPSSEMRKVHNNDVKREDLPSQTQKDYYPVQAVVNDVGGQAGQMSHHEESLDHAEAVERGPVVSSPREESMLKLSCEKSSGHSKSPSSDVPCLSRYYLSKLDISEELAHPDLYSQCLSILGKEGSDIDEDDTMHTVLEAAKVGFGSSRTLLSSSLFPPIKGFVFQKAMKLYKKQIMETKGMPVIAGGTLDIILASNQKNMETKIIDVERVDGSVPSSDAEMTDAPLSSLHEKSVGTASTDSTEVKMEVAESTPNHEVQNHICLCSPKFEMPVEDYSGGSAGEAQTISNGVEMEFPKQVKLEIVDADCSSALDNTPLAITNLPAVGNDLKVLSATKDDNSTYRGKEGAAADALSGPLIRPEGSPKACETLISGSNESDSVILSRIHHSPESTH